MADDAADTLDEQFTTLLAAWSAGDAKAGEQLYVRAYDDLKRVASRTLRACGRGDQLSTTVLVNECYLKLLRAGTLNPENRQHFMALCARAMRQIVVDSARRMLSEKRGSGEVYSLEIDHEGGPMALRPESVAGLEQLLIDLERREPRLARIAECRVFGGLSNEEIATTFQVTVRTVQREWQRIRALLVYVLTESDAGGAEPEAEASD